MQRRTVDRHSLVEYEVEMGQTPGTPGTPAPGTPGTLDSSTNAQHTDAIPDDIANSSNIRFSLVENSTFNNLY